MINADLPGVVAFLNDDEGDARLVRWLKLDASFADGAQLVGEDSLELTFGNAIAN